MKTPLTTQIEHDLYYHTTKMGVYGCFEVTIGFNGKERVDYMTYDTKGIFRCYEIKVSKADFHSKAKLSFCGNYNYLVIPAELYQKIEADVPPDIGIIIYQGNSWFDTARKSKHRVCENPEMLKDSLIRSLARDARRLMESEDVEKTKKLKASLAKTEALLSHERDSLCFWQNRVSEVMDFCESLFGPDWWEKGVGAAFDPATPWGKNPYQDGRPYQAVIYPSMPPEVRESARKLFLEYVKAKKEEK